MLMQHAGGPAAAADGVRFVSPEAALEHGLGAYRSGFYKLAEQALGFAAERNSVLGQYYLARLYADPNASLTNHVRAFELLSDIVKEHATSIQVDDDPRARYVGKALTFLAGYWLRGLPEAGIKANAERAASYLNEAATYFRDPDAQFELAKLYLTGEGVQQDKRQATHWLASLSQKGHAGAQAFLADLYWRGKILDRDVAKALALITLAVENAPSQDRIWIENIYQSIFCGIAPDVRQQSEGLVASFRHRFAPRPGTEPSDAIGLAERPQRACSDGTPLPKARGADAGATPPAAAMRKDAVAPDAAKVAPGGVMGIGEFGTPRK
jgi:hypothetical protein